MVIKQSERTLMTENGAENGTGLLTLDKLLTAGCQPQKLRTFARAELAPGASVGYHVHTNESESYYILSGTGLYHDNGKEVITVKPGDVTFTPSGEGHGIENTGSEPLVFIALIILD